MALKNLQKWEMGLIVVVVLAVPFILVYQLALQPDIRINFEEDDPFRDKCFLGESECIYHQCDFSACPKIIDFREDDTYWWIVGEDVWCVKSQMSFTEPVTNPNLEITQDSEISCNDNAMFDKDDWDLSVFINGEPTYTFTLKGT